MRIDCATAFTRPASLTNEHADPTDRTAIHMSPPCRLVAPWRSRGRHIHFRFQMNCRLLVLTVSLSASDPGCVKTPRARKRGERSFSDRSKSTVLRNSCDADCEPRKVYSIGSSRRRIFTQPRPIAATAVSAECSGESPIRTGVNPNGLLPNRWENRGAIGGYRRSRRAALPPLPGRWKSHASTSDCLSAVLP
jgi:hypothetical protein